MMASLPIHRLTPKEYLAIERGADTRSEYLYGEMVMMAGNTVEHVRIVRNLIIRLGNALEGGPCEPFSTELRVKANETAYVYPDIVVACGEPEFTDDALDTLVNPLVIFEVLSKTTRDYDRGEKFLNYRRLESLRHYILVSQDKPFIELYTLQPNGHWDLMEIAGLDADLVLPAIDCTLALSEVYDRVTFI